MKNLENSDNFYHFVKLQIIPGENGVLGIAESSKQIGFDVKRVYFISDVPNHGRRGGHAHKKLRQCFISLRGSITLELTRGNCNANVTLDTPAKALILDAGCWRDLVNFSDDALLLVLASDEYDEDDYIRSFEAFLNWEKDQAVLPATVPYLDLKRYVTNGRAELDQALDEALDSGAYIGGSLVAQFEQAFATYCGSTHAVGVGNGLEALSSTLKAWGIGPGDEVISPAHTFVATALAISETGATPVLIDVDADTGLIDPEKLAQAVTERTRAVLPVHLYGHPADMDALRAAAPGIVMLEDACQAHGALYKGRPCGSLGEAAAFSFYPTKNLGALGDAGAVITNDAGLAERVRIFSNYGSRQRYRHEVIGINSRLDAVQAKVLLTKLVHLDRWNARRRALAKRYIEELSGIEDLLMPIERPWARSSWHVFPIRVAPTERERLAAHLQDRGVGVNVHYPIPVHLQPCYAGRWFQGQFPRAEQWAASVLSLPLDAMHTDFEIGIVIRATREFFGVG